MAHIADLMVHHTAASMNPFDSFIYSESSQNMHQFRDSAVDDDPMRAKAQPEFVWRMHQPSQGRKYHLFPSRSQDKLSITTTALKKKDNFGRDLAAAMAAIGSSKEKPQPSKAAASPKEKKMERRKKPSVTDLRFMAAIHEASMDSPTIPGRFPVHERSTSAPGHPSWRQSDYAASSEALATADSAQASSVRPLLQRSKSSSSSTHMHSNQRAPRTLAPLIIPSHTDLFPKRTLNRLSEQSVISDTPPEVPPKSARMIPLSSPESASTAPLTSGLPTMTSFSPFTPFSAPLTAPNMTFKSSVTDCGSSSPANALSPSPPAPSSDTATPEAVSSPNSETKEPSKAKHVRNTSDPAMLLNVSKRGHKRSGSETSTIKQRGRAKQRPPPLPGSNPEDSFEALPSGFPAAEAASHMALQELKALGEQALGQAVQFEVLSATHVKSLSKELRLLDERCDYLRTTHRSLRSGRRNLNNRICDYLRSPRTAKFSFDSLLKQEEALAELDASIDDWAYKLELAENRRMRVRQKLLEHVAAALLLPTDPVSCQKQLEPEIELPEAIEEKPVLETATPVSATVERGPAWLDPMTPCTIRAEYPHSPAEPRAHAPATSPFPVRSTSLRSRAGRPAYLTPTTNVTAKAEYPESPAGCLANQVLAPPSIIITEQSPAPAERLALPISAALSSHPVTPKPTCTINAGPSSPSPSWLSPTHEIIKCYQRDRDSYSTTGRPSAESIRIYAGEEVYALLADVEEQIERMSMCCGGVDGGSMGANGMEILKPTIYEGLKGSMRKPSPLRMISGRE